MSKKLKREYSEGEVIQFSYPFVREELDNAQPRNWKPGTRIIEHGSHQTAEADAIGQQIVTVVSVHKPGKFPVRVFFTRKWRDPSGKVFGKNNLRILAQSAFSGLIRGFRHEFDLLP